MCTLSDPYLKCVKNQFCASFLRYSFQQGVEMPRRLASFIFYVKSTLNRSNVLNVASLTAAPLFLSFSATPPA